MTCKVISTTFVTPAQAGVQYAQENLQPVARRMPGESSSLPLTSAKKELEKSKKSRYIGNVILLQILGLIICSIFPRTAITD